MQTQGTRSRRSLAAAAIAATAVAGVAAGSAAAKGHKTLYVSPRGHNTAACTRKKPCKTIAAAVAKAKSGDAIKVAPGIYREDVLVNKRLDIGGQSKPIVNAVGKANGFVITHAGAGSKIHNFRVKNANEEGIAAVSTAHVVIRDNTVTNNDRAVGKATPSGQCQPQGQTPGDCGEGIHLMGTSRSQVTGNLVQGNSGGILLTDETGPSAFNTISRNRVKGNLRDCGITLASHNPKAVTLTGPPAPDTGVPAPTVAGVHHNTITGNNVVGNGVTGGFGAGIQMAGGPPGAAVYDNVVRGNTVTDNGHPGITLHSHAPAQDFNGNQVIGNVVNRNALHGDDTAGIKQTVGILLYSGVDRLTGIVVKGNKITGDHFGIWTKNAPKIAKSANTFRAVAVPLHQE
jgi:parallel beta-helix repeat protein